MGLGVGLGVGPGVGLGVGAGVGEGVGAAVGKGVGEDVIGAFLACSERENCRCSTRSAPATARILSAARHPPHRYASSSRPKEMGPPPLRSGESQNISFFSLNITRSYGILTV